MKYRPLGLALAQPFVSSNHQADEEFLAQPAARKEEIGCNSRPGREVKDGLSRTHKER